MEYRSQTLERGSKVADFINEEKELAFIVHSEKGQRLLDLFMKTTELTPEN